MCPELPWSNVAALRAFFACVAACVWALVRGVAR